MTPHDHLVALLAERSARRGSFTLASGRQSSLYIDARLTTMSPEGMTLIGPLALSYFFELIRMYRAEYIEPDVMVDELPQKLAAGATPPASVP